LYKSNTIAYTEKSNIVELLRHICLIQTIFVIENAFWENFVFVTYASMGVWHAAVAKGLSEMKPRLLCMASE